VVSFESLTSSLEPTTGADVDGDRAVVSAVRVPIGIADRPERQTQRPYRIDLGQAGHVAVYGSPGSGKTELLRTLACSLSLAVDDVVIYGIDFGSGLRAIDSLPTVADVVGGSELERLQLLMAMLETEVTQRLEPTDPIDTEEGEPVERESGERERPTIVVLIDGFGPFWTTLESFDFGRQADRFARLLSRAPSAGVHMVMTADQRSAIPFNCLGSIGLRILQRLASVDEYRTLGMTTAPNPESMRPGRTMVVEGPEVQVALTDAAGLAAVVDTLQGRGVAVAAPPVRALGEVVVINEIAPSESLSSVAIGLGPAHDDVGVDLVDQPTLLIVGSPGSGRTTALLTLGAQLEPVVADRRAIAGKRAGPLTDGRCAFLSVATGDDAATTLAQLATEIEQRSRNGYAHPMVVAVDDADVFFDDNHASTALNTLVLKGRDAGVVVLMAASSFRAGTAYETWIRAMRSNGHGLVLQPDGDKEEDLFDVRFPRGSALRFPVGRGYLVARSTVRAVQVALPG